MNASLIDQHNPVGKRHSLFDVMGDKHRRTATLPPEIVNQSLHFQASQGVERGKRLVEKKQPRVADQRTGQSNALLLTSRQDRRPIVGAGYEIHAVEGSQNGIIDSAASSDRDIRIDSHPRQEPRVLEDHPGLAIEAVERHRVDKHLSAGRPLEPSQETQQRALAAAATTYDGNELIGPDR